jgi:uncharacterized membrane protein YoaK (UPF0700 family)
MASTTTDNAVSDGASSGRTVDTKKAYLAAVLPSENTIVSVLAFVGGFVDTVGYLELLGIFTSSITGNIVVASASMTSTRGVFCRFIVTLSFVVCAAVNSGISLYLKLGKMNEHRVSAILFLLEALCLTIALIVGTHLLPSIADAEDADHWSIVVVACIMACGMGLHNGAVKETIASGPSTTVVTMTLVTIANLFSKTCGFYIAQLSAHAQLTDSVGHEEEDDQENDKARAEAQKLREKYFDSLEKLFNAVRILVFFIVGAVLGAVICYHGAKFIALIVPVVMVLGLSGVYMIKAYLNPTVTKKGVNSTGMSPKRTAEPSAAPLVSKATSTEFEMVALSDPDQSVTTEPNNPPFS